MPANLHLIKLCVGVEHPQELIDWQKKRSAALGRAYAMHITRMWPKREAELIDGGSLYWVMKGQIKARQKILRLEEIIGEDGIRRCGVILNLPMVRVSEVPRRAFQGWRYLNSSDAPPDLDRARVDEERLPEPLANALVEFGIR